MGQIQKQGDTFRKLSELLKLKMTWSKVAVMEMVRNGKILNIFSR